MTILYVAGPMTGVKDLNYPEFRKITKRLEVFHFTVLDPSTIDEQFPKNCGHFSTYVALCKECVSRSHTWYMRRAIVMLAQADGVALLRGWERSKGAVVEQQLARSLGIPTQMWYDWIAYEARRLKDQEKEKRNDHKQ